MRIYNVGEDEWKRNGALIPDEAYLPSEHKGPAEVRSTQLERDSVP